MDGENNGEPYLLMDDLGAPLFLVYIQGGPLLVISGVITPINGQN